MYMLTSCKYNIQLMETQNSNKTNQFNVINGEINFEETEISLPFFTRDSQSWQIIEQTEEQSNIVESHNNSESNQSTQESQNPQRKHRQDNNISKASNPILTKISKQVLHIKGKIFIKTLITPTELKFKSLKSNRKYFVVWMIYIQSKGQLIQNKAYETFDKYMKKFDKDNISEAKKNELKLALLCFKMYKEGQFQKSIQTYYGLQTGNLRQKHHLDDALDFLRKQRTYRGLVKHNSLIQNPN